MIVQLPETGCNIVANDYTIYNYVNNNYRDTYTLYEGRLFLRESSSSTYGYNYTGTCVSTGDLIYKPEYDVVFQFMAFALVAFTFILIYQILFKRFLR